MRNLKKFLALILAMVMAMSLMLTANAAGFDGYQDKDSIDPAFSEAVEVLTGLGVFTGDDRGFAPKDTITRAEVAAIIYRLATGDVTDAQVKVYADYGNFVDVKSDAWYAGYVGYCTNAGYIKGQAGNRFNPSGNVTGYQALAMILRAVGYDKNREFEGASWQVNVASLSKQLGVTKNVVNANFETTLNYAATREVIADLLFMTATTVPTVTYTTSLQYNDKETITSTRFNPTLGQKIFGLWVRDAWLEVDEWGRPGYRWYQGGRDSGSDTTAATGGAYMVPVGHPIYAGSTIGTTVATIEAPYSLEFKTTKLECDVAADLNIKVDDEFVLYVNGDSNQQVPGIQPITDEYHIVATDTVTKVGGQGRVSEFYRNVSSPWLSSSCNRVVMIDTLLAQVTTVSAAKLDKNDHVIVPAKMEVTIYDGGVTNAPNGNNGNSKRIISKPSTSKDNWEYGKGDMILIHAYTNKGARITVPENNTLLEASAFETDPVIGTDNPTTTLTEGSNVWVEKKADSFTGKQTTAYWNANKHQVDGKDYDDQLCLFLDRAGQATNTTFTWYQDLYGNIIGIADKIASFGVITSIYAAFGQGASDTNGRVKAMANVKYADGTTGTIAIDKFLMSCTNTSDVITHAGTANTDPDTQLTTTLSTVELWPRYDSSSHPAMTVGDPDVAGYGTTEDAAAQGFLYLAPSSVTNFDAHFSTAGTYPQQDTYGILFDHMFQFVIASDDSVVAIEVAGSTDPATPNLDIYADKYNNVSGAANAEGKIFKNLSYMVLSNTNASSGGTAGAINTVYLDNDTQIMVYNGATSVVTYNGVGSLPGDVTLSPETEVDWADTDGDGRANYVYVWGEIPGVVTYNLFYNNGGGAQWNGTTGTIAGYLNGEATTVTFNNYNLYNIVNNSANYDAHLFALQITNGVVSSVMYADNEASSTFGQLILADYTSGTGVNTSGVVLEFDADAENIGNAWVDNISLDTSAGTATTGFKTGSANGNTYTVSTEAVYWHDSIEVNVANGNHNVAYERVSQGNRIVVSGATAGGVDVEYWIAPSCKIIGELEWLNQRECDVTMVYEAGTINSVIQLYITSDPDVTPTDPDANIVYGNRPYSGNGVVSYPATTTALDNALSNGVRDTVLYSTQKPTADPIGDALDVMGAGVPATSLMYFPFSCADSTYATLEIRDQFGNLVYSEGHTFTTGGLVAAKDVHAFVINFKGGAAANPSGSAPGLPLMITNAAGQVMTYTFTIYTSNASGNVILSTGSFGMN